MLGLEDIKTIIYDDLKADRLGIANVGLVFPEDMDLDKYVEAVRTFSREQTALEREIERHDEELKEMRASDWEGFFQTTSEIVSGFRERNDQIRYLESIRDVSMRLEKNFRRIFHEFIRKAFSRGTAFRFEDIPSDRPELHMERAVKIAEGQYAPADEENYYATNSKRRWAVSCSEGEDPSIYDFRFRQHPQAKDCSGYFGVFSQKTDKRRPSYLILPTIALMTGYEHSGIEKEVFNDIAEKTNLRIISFLRGSELWNPDK